MRPFIAVLASTVILGGLYLYMEKRPRYTVAVEARDNAAEGTFSVELVIPFDAGPDPFALETTSAPSVELLLRGESLIQKQESVPAHSQLVVDDVKGIVAGKNEFFVMAMPSENNPNAVRGVRVRVLRDGSVLAEQSLWSEPGEPVQGVVTVDVPRYEFAPGHDHD